MKKIVKRTLIIILILGILAGLALFMAFPGMVFGEYELIRQGHPYKGANEKVTECSGIELDKLFEKDSDFVSFDIMEMRSDRGLIPGLFTQNDIRWSISGLLDFKIDDSAKEFMSVCGGSFSIHVRDAGKLDGVEAPQVESVKDVSKSKVEEGVADENLFGGIRADEIESISIGYTIRYKTMKLGVSIGSYIKKGRLSDMEAYCDPAIERLAARLGTMNIVG